MTMTSEAKSNSSGVVVTAVAMTAPDIESQQMPSAIANPSVYADRDDDAGKGMGIAMVVLLIIGVISIFIFPMISYICIIATITIASILTCGCASDYNLKPNVKRFATATLVSLCLVLILQIIFFVGFFLLWGSMSTEFVDGASAGLFAAGCLSIVFYITAIVFSALFTWGRGCGAS